MASSQTTSLPSVMITAAKMNKKMWDATSTLTESQKEVLATLAEFASIRPLPVDEWNTEEENVSEMPENESFLDISSTFAALADVETQRDDNEIADVLEQQSRLKGILNVCDEILSKLSHVNTALSSLQDQHDLVVSKTSAVHTECETLSAEKTELDSVVKAMQSRLSNYDELESLQRQLASPNMQVASPGFLPLLTKIDEGIAHLTSNPHFENTAVYLGRFRQLQARAAAMVKAYVSATLEAATERVNAVLKETMPAQDSYDASNGDGPTPVPRVESGLIAYVQYQAVSESVKPLLTDLARRAARSWEYSDLVDECQAIYYHQRQSLLHSSTVTRLQAALGLGSLDEGLRTCCTDLCDLCHREHKLAQHFFPPLERPGLPALMDPLCQALVDAARPLLLKMVSVAELCAAAHVLKGDILEDRVEMRGESLAPMRTCVLGLVHEVQERLTFRAQVFIRDEIQSFVPSKDDIDYPARLQRAGPGGAGGAGSWGDEGGEWCPVLPRTLGFLSQVYRTVGDKIFEGLAQEAVMACTEALLACSRAVGRAKGPADGALFLVMHLLKLREQIVPFDVDFSSTELSLDFSDTRTALASLLSSRRSLLAWSSSNAFLSLAKAPPRVFHTMRNAKKDLERELKQACEAFILLAAGQVAQPCVAWVHKADALIPPGAAAGRANGLREHAFAQPDRVKELMAHVKKSVAALQAEVVPKMGQYLANPQTRGVLLTPIRNNIVDAYARVHAYLLAEFEAEEYLAMGVLAPEELAAALGGHSVVLLSAASEPSTPAASDAGANGSFLDESTGAVGLHLVANSPTLREPPISPGWRGSDSIPTMAGPAGVAQASNQHNGLSAAAFLGSPAAQQVEGVSGARDMEAATAVLEASAAAAAILQQSEEMAAREAQDRVDRERAEKDRARVEEEQRALETAAREVAAKKAEAEAQAAREREVATRKAAAEDAAARDAAREREAVASKAATERAEAAERELALQRSAAAAAAATKERAAREAAAEAERVRKEAEGPARQAALANASQPHVADKAAPAATLPRRGRPSMRGQQEPPAPQAEVGSAAAAAADGGSDGEDEYGPWTGFPAPDLSPTPATKDARAPPPDSEVGPQPPPETAHAGSLGDAATPHANGAAARPSAARASRARPLASLHRGAPTPAPAAVAAGPSAAPVSPEGRVLAAAPTAAAPPLPPRASSPPHPAPATVPASAAPPAPVSAPPPATAGPPPSAAAPAAAGKAPAKLPPGFAFVDGKLKYVGR